jgi:hypothetical protein
MAISFFCGSRYARAASRSFQRKKPKESHKISEAIKSLYRTQLLRRSMKSQLLNNANIYGGPLSASRVNNRLLVFLHYAKEFYFALRERHKN